MSEEQGKPKKNLVSKPMQYLVILFILLMIAGFLVVALTEPHIDYAREHTYDTAKIELQNAVKDYQNKNNGALPTINGTVTINGSAYAIIDICPLLTQNEESLQKVVDSLWCGNGSNDDNWDGGCAQCEPYRSYVWAVDDEGNVYSTCVGERCNTSGIDGFQGFP